MPTPQEVKDAWENAKESIDSGDHEAALSGLRNVWSSHPKDADVHQTWSLVADAEGIKASSSGKPGDYRKSIKHYEKALNLFPYSNSAISSLNELKKINNYN